MSSLADDQEETVKAAGSAVWKVERSFVQNRVRQRLPLSNAILYNQIALNGVQSTALGIAAVFWAIIGWSVAILIGIPLEVVLDPSYGPVRWTGLVIGIGLFGIGLGRMLISQLSKVKFQSR